MKPALGAYEKGNRYNGIDPNPDAHKDEVPFLRQIQTHICQMVCRISSEKITVPTTIIPAIMQQNSPLLTESTYLPDNAGGMIGVEFCVDCQNKKCLKLTIVFVIAMTPC